MHRFLYRVDDRLVARAAAIVSRELLADFLAAGARAAQHDLLREQPNPSRERIREHLSGNYCRCTGYQAIVDAIEAVAKARAARAG